ncbi:glycine betaine ABC transporter substrate-binding protein [Corynebacterium marquesiae]|uniref:glycine betaine ABC transporter substrate-binding protein n=1 Tax=Corynebacterium marquesiae TaxID=2913503 RepID=UPI00324B6858
MRRPSFLPSPTHTRHYSASDVPTEVLDEHPEIEELFALLSQLLNDEKTQELYARVDVDGEDYTTVSLDFLQEENLIAD